MTDILSREQVEAVNKMHNGCILNGGVGSGKSRTALYYYFKEQGGRFDSKLFTFPKNSKSLYIITTAKKRDSLEWEKELALFLLHPEESENKVVVDSWNNIKKYKDVKNAFFIFDEDHVTGYGEWTKTFLKITKWNKWIILSATPGDKWEDYIPVFIANGFYHSKGEFEAEHIVYEPFVKFKKVRRYLNTGRLVRLRRKILVDIPYKKHTIAHHEDVWVDYDTFLYKRTLKDRWDPYEQEPFTSASGLCYCLRKICNTDESRQEAALKIFAEHPNLIIFYNFDYERDILYSLNWGDAEIAELSGHAHKPVPESSSWVYLVQYNAGKEAWNCTKTDTILFFSQNYSYKDLVQSCGRIDRRDTPYKDLYYYHLHSHSSIDIAILKALKNKKNFNEGKFVYAE